MRLARFLSLVLVLMVQLSPASASGAQQTAQPGCAAAVPQSSGDASKAVAASNDFGFRLFDYLVGHTGTHNVFMSPISASLALDMTYDGARGSTQAVMAQALSLKGMSRQEVRRSAAALLIQLQRPDANVRLELANSVWARLSVAFQQQFLAHAQRDYGAKVTTLDFSAPSAPSTINAWVSCATHGKITSIINRVSPRAVIYLLNAVYFHGGWSIPFNPRFTRTVPFHTASGVKHQVPLMQMERELTYSRTPDFDAVSLSYGTGRFSMVVLQPAKNVSLATFARHLTISNWEQWTAHPWSNQMLSLALPRFTLRNMLPLKEPLMALGMAAAFGGAGDFAGIRTDRSCQLTDARQKTYLNVDEKGTTAAAVTVVDFGTVVVAPIPFVIDHPFFVVIRDKLTGAILFLGAINDPKE